MISTTHITTGAALGLAIGRLIPNPIIAIPLAVLAGIISHHILDSIPHTDPGSFRVDENDDAPAKAGELLFAVPDNIVATLFVLLIFFTKELSWPMLFGAVGGNLPDVWHNVGKWADYSRRVLPQYFKIHEKYHFTARGNLIPLGIVTNVIFIIFSVWYLLK